jgi:L-ribulose-5-phosphate 3-epimerase UlaE
MKGVQTVKRSTDMIVLPAEFYDMNTWDTEGKPESTRRRWRTGIAKRLESLEEAAVVHATEIFDKEEIFIDAA